MLGWTFNAMSTVYIRKFLVYLDTLRLNLSFRNGVLSSTILSIGLFFLIYVDPVLLTIFRSRSLFEEFILKKNAKFHQTGGSPIKTC